MSSNISYEKDTNQKGNVNERDVCDVQGKRQTSRNSRASKGNEDLGREESDDCFPQPCADDPPQPYCSTSTRKNKPRLCAGSPTGKKKMKGKVCDPDYRFTDADYGDELCHFPDGTKTLPPHCYEVPRPRKCQPCTKKTKWQNAKYCRDDCGSGIIPLRYNHHISRRIWCRTPLTTYQASHGELGRQILCREKVIKRLINDGPPCNICEYILPPCRGYYKQYDCVKPCADESENIVFRDGRNRMRDRVERYWESCFSAQAKQDVNTYAPQNMALALKYRKKAFGGTGAPCW